MGNIITQIAALRKEIRKHDYLYYKADAPVLTDYEYDVLWDRLKKLEDENPELITSDSPTQVVGGGDVTAADAQD